jgi:uncharacterized protein (TIGR02145 family)
MKPYLFQTLKQIFLALIILLFACKKEKVPTVSTILATSITASTAISGGEITDEGSGTVITRGVCWSTSITPTLSDSFTNNGAGAGSYKSDLSGLNGGSTYYFRAYATNHAGTGYGMTMSFTTLGQAPSAIANPASNITSTSVILSGLVNPNYLSTNVSFEIGTTTNYGISVPCEQNPVTGNAIVSVTAKLSGLVNASTYHFRIKAVNSLGNYTGEDMTFDGNDYNTVLISNQLWMVENLKTTKYSDGTNIDFPNSDKNAWQANTSGAYAWYNDDPSNKIVYGALYNWHAVKTNKLCPTGWRVSTDADWTSMTNYLGGENLAGGKLKETGTTHWNSPNVGATNESGFTAIPGGDRLTDGTYTYFGNGGIYWTATYKDTYSAWFWALDKITATIGRADREKGVGLSVRCIKN